MSAVPLCVCYHCCGCPHEPNPQNSNSHQQDRCLWLVFHGWHRLLNHFIQEIHNRGINKVHPSSLSSPVYPFHGTGWSLSQPSVGERWSSLWTSVQSVTGWTDELCRKGTFSTILKWAFFSLKSWNSYKCIQILKLQMRIHLQYCRSVLTGGRWRHNLQIAVLSFNPYITCLFIISALAMYYQWDAIFNDVSCRQLGPRVFTHVSWMF